MAWFRFPSFLSIISLLLCFRTTKAFSPRPIVCQSNVILKMGYVPDGMTPAEWKAKQAAEKAVKSRKNFGAFGPQSFKSRSMQAFQTDLEKGKAGHLMPVFNAKDKIKSGKLKQEDIPYMQRGGAWDNSDVKGAKKKKWLEDDKKYKQNSTQGGGWDWTGREGRKGPAQPKKTSAVAPKKKGIFGW